ncbi:hypothetical protein [Streptomyces sp. NPDC050416]|uniref:hypothetical protein n=1 Tax=Streptomyces sp. NPDC050416 TaxID=3365611 RepID=UPI0037AB2521
MRPLSPPDAPRVKACRRRAREGRLAPVLLWFVTPLDGWLILDGHDRAVAAPAEGSDTECVVLARPVDDDVWRRLRNLTDEYERRTAAPARRPGAADHRLAEGLGTALADPPCETARTVARPLPGGTAAWDDLAARAMFECPRD